MTGIVTHPSLAWMDSPNSPAEEIKSNLSDYITGFEKDLTHSNPISTRPLLILAKKYQIARCYWFFQKANKLKFMSNNSSDDHGKAHT